MKARLRAVFVLRIEEELMFFFTIEELLPTHVEFLQQRARYRVIFQDREAGLVQRSNESLTRIGVLAIDSLYYHEQEPLSGIRANIPAAVKTRCQHQQNGQYNVATCTEL